MDALTRQEYPAMLERLQPDAAVAKLNERVKKIGKVNLEIADWLQERRKIEDAYSTSLLKLARKSQQDAGGDTGGFESVWRQITSAAENIGKSHGIFSERIKLDIEQSLRNFAATNSEMSSIINMQGNISNVAKELIDAQERFDRLNRKGNKSNSPKYDSAVSRLQTANQQWDAQAPFVFETLQALDESRLKNLQDMLAMYQTHEADHNERNTKVVERTLKSLLDFDAEVEIKSWSQANASIESKSAVKRNPRAGLGFAALPSPTSPSRLGDIQSDNHSEHSQPSKSEFGEKNKLQRIGTIFTRRRQSVHSVFRSASPGSRNGFQPFNRATSSRAGRPIPSPRASSSHLREPENRLGPLPEMPHPPSTTDKNDSTLNTTASIDFPPRKNSISPQSRPISSERAGVVDSDPPLGSTNPPAKGTEVDNEGFSIPPPAEDLISQAQMDQPQFKLDIRKDPIPEQDSDAQAALSNVANTLRSAQISTPIRKLGTVRGRRDARHTMSAQSEEHLAATLEYTIPVSPAPTSPVISSRRTVALTNLSSNEHNHLAGSDNMSIQSGQSWINQGPVKHPELLSPGLNCSIVETISASFEGEQAKLITIHGEVALIFNPDVTDNMSTISSDEKIRVKTGPNLEILSLNKNIIDSMPGESSNEFTVHLPFITSKSIVSLNYRVLPPESSLASAPLLIKSAWRHQNEKLGMILEYSLNPAYSSAPTLFSNLILIAHYAGEPASSCQTKPNGTHLRDKLMVYWRLGDIILDQKWCKAVARFSCINGAVPEPGQIEARWELHNTESLPRNVGSYISIQKIGNTAIKDTESDKGVDPFADESSAGPSTVTAPIKNTWVELQTVKTRVSGKYVAK